MARISYLLALLMCVGLMSCSGGDSSSNTRYATSPGTLVFGEVTGQIEPKEGGDEDAIAGAQISAQSRPEVAGETDSEGKFKISNITPGKLNVLITSDDGGSLRLEANFGAKYGLKFDDIVVTSGESTDLGLSALKETGSLVGNIAYYDNPNNLDLTGAEVFIPGTSYIVKTDAEGKFALTGLPPGLYDLRLQQVGFSVLDLNEVEVFEGQQSDLGTKVLSLSTGPEGAISVNFDVTKEKGSEAIKIVKSRTAIIQIEYDSDAALMKISDEPSFLNKKWQAVAKTSEWLFDSDGKKSLYVQFSDLNGLESSPYNVSFYIDTEVPTIEVASALHGWAQSSQRQIFVDTEASDTGSGVAEIAFAHDVNDFSASTWLDYNSRNDITLSAGAGTKTVYVRIKDYAGNVSAVSSDTIDLGDYTIIENRTYTEDEIVLRKAQSPFQAGGVSITSNVEIEAGVELNISGSFTVDGVLTAIGSTADPITIKTLNAPASGMDCSGSSWGTVVDLSTAPAGTSAQNRLQYIDFIYIRQIRLNGGTVSHSNFDNSACTAAEGGSLKKSGYENLVVSDSVFTKYQSAIQVTEGVANTVFRSNSGTVSRRVVWQNESSSATVFTDNSFTMSSSNGCFLEIDSGTIQQTEDSNNEILASSNGYALCLNYGSGEVIMNGISMNDGNGIVLIPDVSFGFDATINNSTFTNIPNGIVIPNEGTGGHTLAVSINDSTITVSEKLVSLTAQSNIFHFDGVFTGNTISCVNGAGFCDFLNAQFGMDAYGLQKLRLTNNTINCSSAGGNGCRGFYFNNTASAGGSGSASITLDVAGNTWNDKSLAASLDANVKDQQAIFDDTQIYLYRDDSGGMGPTTITWSVTQ